MSDADIDAGAVSAEDMQQCCTIIMEDVIIKTLFESLHILIGLHKVASLKICPTLPMIDASVFNPAIDAKRLKVEVDRLFVEFNRTVNPKPEKKKKKKKKKKKTPPPPAAPATPQPLQHSTCSGGNQTNPYVMDEKDIRMIGSKMQRKNCESFEEIKSNVAKWVISVLEDSRPFYESVDTMDKAGVLPDYKTSVNKFYYQKKLGCPSVLVSFYDVKRMVKGLKVNWERRTIMSKERMTFSFTEEHNDFTYEFKCIPAYFDIKG
jgi:hypothetical protein